MNREDIIRMAREAGFEDFDRWCQHYPQETKRWCERMERFFHMAQAAEREACIDIVAIHGGSVEIEAVIRARGQA